VLVSGVIAEKPARLVSRTDVLAVSEPRRFVSRGGEKLSAALDGFDLDVAGRTCLDAGASTGGFTDCQLQRGALRVWAVDVGRGQLAPEIRADERVVVVERCNVRHATLESLGADRFEVVVADLAFISLTRVARKLAEELAAPGADVVVLVKPQFEAGRRTVDKGRGVVRDPEVWRSTTLEVGNAFLSLGAAIMGVMPSPVLGPSGNVEFLLHLRAAGGRTVPEPSSDMSKLLSDLTDAAVSAAVAARSPGTVGSTANG
jgi:23S rRNA (cytidine1920-2'-O)/16S rRNA (cytidine1409-2'-O)-methyltransferase